MARLSVNLNKIALLRNSRRTGVPDLRTFARIAIEAGALSDLTVAACNGDKVTLRATVGGAPYMLPNVKAAHVERC